LSYVACFEQVVLVERQTRRNVPVRSMSASRLASSPVWTPRLVTRRWPMLGTILLIILVLLLIGALPSWPYSATWGTGVCGPSRHRARRRPDPRAARTNL